MFLCFSDGFLEDFLLTHVIFMPYNHLCPVLLSQYPCCFKSLHNNLIHATLGITLFLNLRNKVKTGNLQYRLDISVHLHWHALLFCKKKCFAISLVMFVSMYSYLIVALPQLNVDDEVVQEKTLKLSVTVECVCVSFPWRHV